MDVDIRHYLTDECWALEIKTKNQQIPSKILPAMRFGSAMLGSIAHRQWTIGTKWGEKTEHIFVGAIICVCLSSITSCSPSYLPGLIEARKKIIMTLHRICAFMVVFCVGF